MKKSILLLFVFCALVTNTFAQQKENVSSVDSAFGVFSKQFIDELWTLYPLWATSVGYHQYDSLLPAPDAKYRIKELRFIARYDTLLHKFKADELSPYSRMDFRLMENFIGSTRFQINKFKSYEWDPSGYNLGGNFFDVVDYKKASLNDRLRTLAVKFAKVPAYYVAAKANINKPTREHTELAIQQFKGTLLFLEKDLQDSIKLSSLSVAEIAVLNQHAGLAKKSINEFVNWLSALLPAMNEGNSRSFRIGKTLYEQKYKYDLCAGYSLQDMYNKALERKSFVHAEMSKLADRMWPVYFGSQTVPADSLQKIKLLIDTLSTHHCKREDFLSVIEKQLPELVTFVNQNHLLGLDPTKPLEVRKTPDYMAGVAGASLSSPGPYDRGGVTYYNVTPLTNYSATEAESYLREYNDYVLQILNIHEAIPGHYVQGIYANRSSSIIKSVLGNGATIEGWACYVERMMLEQGYKDSPEMLLFYYKWNLREVCNFILDYNVHCNNWQYESAQRLLQTEAFQQETEVKEKYKRATLSQVQLASYFTGLTEIYEFREEAKLRFGDKFKLNKFHERFLSFGSAPVKEIKAVLMKQGQNKE